MSFSKRAAIALGAGALALSPAAAMAWTKSFLVTWMEPAFYYGGPDNGSAIALGTDCPTGVNTMDFEKLLATPYRSKAELERVFSPEFERQRFNSNVGFRGPNRENVYESPTTVPDPGLIEMTGKLAFGFDLDDNPNTGFTGVDGAMGVDNGFYKVVGCTDFFRGKPREAFSNKNVNEQMQSHMTLIVVMSGEGADPMNDDDVNVGIYSSKDQATKDPSGAFTRDYSFKIDPTDQSVFKAKSVNGVVEAVDRPTITVRFSSKRNPAKNNTILYLGKARFQLQPDGSATGLIAGYRDWRDLYIEMHGVGHTRPAAQTETLGHFSLPGMFYSLRRNADGLPDPVTGKKRGISSVYRLDMIPAFAINPKGDAQLNVAGLVDRGATGAAR